MRKQKMNPFAHVEVDSDHVIVVRESEYVPECFESEDALIALDGYPARDLVDSGVLHGRRVSCVGLDVFREFYPSIPDTAAEDFHGKFGPSGRGSFQVRWVDAELAE